MTTTNIIMTTRIIARQTTLFKRQLSFQVLKCTRSEWVGKFDSSAVLSFSWFLRLEIFIFGPLRKKSSSFFFDSPWNENNIIELKLFDKILNLRADWIFPYSFLHLVCCHRHRLLPCPWSDQWITLVTDYVWLITKSFVLLSCCGSLTSPFSRHQVLVTQRGASPSHQVHVSGQGPECYVASFLLCSKCQGAESDEWVEWGEWGLVLQHPRIS